MFITIEGIDGSGKTTLVRELCLALKKEGVCFVQTSEPGGQGEASSFSGLIRSIFSHHTEEIPVLSELLLLLSARVCNIEKVILPALRNDHWVISDRFNDSTYAYQGYGSGFDLKTMHKLIEQSGCNLEPDLTFVIDVSPKDALARIKNPDAFEKRSCIFHEKVQEGYHLIAQRFPKRVFLLQGNKSSQDLVKEVFRLLNSKGFLQSKV